MGRPATTAGSTTDAFSMTAITSSITCDRASTGRCCRPARPRRRAAQPWPPVLRWLDSMSLESLERLVLRSTWLQRFVVGLPRTCVSSASRRAAGDPACHHRRRWFVPANRAGLAEGVARSIVDDCRCQRRAISTSRERFFDGTDRTPALHIPFAAGVTVERAGRRESRCDSARLHRRPRSALSRAHMHPRMLVHDWIWRREGTRRDSVVVPAQATEPRYTMRAACLFVVLVSRRR